MFIFLKHSTQRLVLNMWRMTAPTKMGKSWPQPALFVQAPEARSIITSAINRQGSNPLAFASVVLPLAATPKAATAVKGVVMNSQDAGVSDAGLQDAAAQIDSGKDADSKTNYLTVSKGQITFDSEGGEAPGTIIHSRVPHVPCDRCGVTIGRGYDLKQKSESRVRNDFKSIGLSDTKIEAYIKGIGKMGDEAKEYIKNNKEALGEISLKQQKELFEKMYDFVERDAERLATKKDVVEKYGVTDWGALDQKIKDIVVDLHYQGLYWGKQKELIQPSILKNDIKEFTEILSDRNKWPMVSDLRFKQRVEYLTGKPMEDKKPEAPKNKKKP